MSLPPAMPGRFNVGLLHTCLDGDARHYAYAPATAEALAERIRAFGHRSVEFVGTIDRAVEAVLSVAGEGDLVITQGAGNVWQAGEKVLK